MHPCTAPCTVPAPVLLIQVMLGGAWFEQAFGPPSCCDEEWLGRVAVDVVAAQLGVKEPPVTIRTNVLKVGHSACSGEREC